MRVFVRYHTEDDKGETRAERNERAEHETPPLDIPEAGSDLFDLFFNVSRSINRISDGVCQKITPSELKAYLELADERLTPTEFDIFRAMDLEYCTEMQLEINARNEKFRDEARRGGK